MAQYVRDVADVGKVLAHAPGNSHSDTTRGSWNCMYVMLHAFHCVLYVLPGYLIVTQLGRLELAWPGPQNNALLVFGGINGTD